MSAGPRHDGGERPLERLPPWSISEDMETFPAPLLFEPRPLTQSLWRGFRCHCPNCGEGRLFGRFLKPVATCAVCGEDFTHHRADDFPPYVTMVVVGHLVVPFMLTVAMTTTLSIPVQVGLWVSVVAALTLALLQPVKGAIIALQWALRMHGFDGRTEEADQFFP